MRRELLIKYFNNQCTDAELQKVFSWLNDDERYEEHKSWGFDIWNSWADQYDVEDDDFIAIFDKISERIEAGNLKNNKALSHSFRLKVAVNWLTKAAAILLIPALTFLFYTLSEKKIESARYANLLSDTLEVMAPTGAKTIVSLSDGSVVQLNYGSKIRYPQFFSGNTREITLYGEGFFQVAHNPEKPFIVKAGNLNVKAVGTSFNVLAYPDNDIVETTLITGKVILEQVNHNGGIVKIGAMVPGQHIDVNKHTGSVSSIVGNTEKYISWTKGKLIFEDTPILEVTERLSRMFNVDFEVKGEIRDYNYTVTFDDDPLLQILDLMTIATPISYKTLPRTKLPDGSYTKQKIILKKR